MSTLTSEISVKFRPETSAILKQKARTQKMSLPEVVMEIVEDAIGAEEAEFLVMRAERNRKESKGEKLYTHEEAWGVK